MSAWVGQYEQLKRICLWTKVHQIFSANVEGVVVDKILFRFAIYRSVPEIFAMEVESCQKSRRILDVFSPSQILGGLPSKSYTHFITPTSRYVAWKRFCEDTPISPEVLAHTLNFKPNFKFSRLIFFFGGGDPVPVLWCALARLGQSVTCVTILWDNTPKGQNVVCRKMSAWVGQYEQQNVFVCGPKFTKFFTQRGMGCS